MGLNAELFIDDKSVVIKDIKKMNGLWKGKGLMFASKDKADALLFEFSTDVNRTISSIFCPPFLGVWLSEDNKVIDYKIISPGKFSISSPRPFRKLIEVPLNSKYSDVIEFVLERGKV
ncbi:hypothetical protein COU61_01625 [Candidatus Pacearchaeota archaeon CG10_big_fil_rev_8_21_14_0_10_35_13]|nr:MAG: hypothetical protein COU61_01625 [Candidatus Pacearchaeota archaeon CG10_big_fil_rev_8_21_14_0_10_35_13]